MTDNLNSSSDTRALAETLSRQLDTNPNGADVSLNNNESTWSKVTREAYVLGDGLASGFAQGAVASVHDPLGTGLRLATAVGTGVALTVLSKGGALPALLAEGVGAGMTLSFAADVVKPERLQALGQVASDTWASDKNTDANIGVVSNQLGRFAFDTALMSVGAVGGVLGKARPFFEEKNLFRSSAGKSYDFLRSGSNAATNRFDLLGTQRELPSMDVFPSGDLSAPRHGRVLTASTLSLPFSELRFVDKLTVVTPRATQLWMPSEASIATRVEAQNFVKAFMTKDYHGALETSIGAKVMEHVELNHNPRAQSIDVTARELKDPERVQMHMSQIAKIGLFKWDERVSGGEIIDNKLRVNVPRSVVELENGGAKVALVDYVETSDNNYKHSYKVEYPNKTITGEPLTAEQTAEIESIRKSAVGQRVLAETAIIAFEESIAHANQHITASGAIISPTYARFNRDFSIEKGVRPAFLNFLGMIGKEHPQRVDYNEMEVPAILYDAGMPLPLIEHHYFFGGRHIRERTSLITYLRGNEASDKFDFAGPHDQYSEDSWWYQDPVPTKPKR